MISQVIATFMKLHQLSSSRQLPCHCLKEVVQLQGRDMFESEPKTLYAQQLRTAFHSCQKDLRDDKTRAVLRYETWVLIGFYDRYHAVCSWDELHAKKV